MCIHFTCKYVCRKQRQNWSIPGEAEGEVQSRPFYMYWLNSPKFHTPVLLSFWKRLHIQPPPAPPASRGLPNRWKRHCSVGCFISYGGVKAAQSCLLMSHWYLEVSRAFLPCCTPSDPTWEVARAVLGVPSSMPQYPYCQTQCLLCSAVTRASETELELGGWTADRTAALSLT